MNELEAIKYSNENEAGQALFELVKKGFTFKDEEIYEYDFQLIEDESLFFKIEQRNYLLINKIFIKKIYMHWRNVYFLSNQTNDQKLGQETSSFILLLINPNFASAWSIRKNLVESSNGTEMALKNELMLNKLVLTKNFKCEQAFVVIECYYHFNVTF